MCVHVARAMPLDSYFHSFTIKALDFQSMCCHFCQAKALLLSLTLILSAVAPRAKLASCNIWCQEWDPSQPIVGYNTVETRSATKQHELEEQIGSLATLMQELKAGQAKQAKRNEEQQTRLLEELRTSIQRQEQQLTRLADDHEKWLDALTSNQTEAVETVASLEKNFSSTTSVMQDRLGVSEDRLGKLAWSECTHLLDLTCS